MRINQESSPASSGVDQDLRQLNQRVVSCEQEIADIKDLLVDKTSEAWKLYNILEFMVAAIPEDQPGGLPVQCTLVDLREDARNLAIGLMEIRDNPTQYKQILAGNARR